MGSKLRLLGIALVALLLSFVGGRALWRALASPQTKIRWRIESMVEGFHSMRAKPVLQGLAPEFRDASSGATREDVHQILAWLFLQETDPQTGEFLWSCEFDPKQLSIELAPGSDSAEVVLDLRFQRQRGGRAEVFWDAHVTGSFALGEDGWQWSGVTAANHRDRKRL